MNFIIVDFIVIMLILQCINLILKFMIHNFRFFLGIFVHFLCIIYFLLIIVHSFQFKLIVL